MILCIDDHRLGIYPTFVFVKKAIGILLMFIYLAGTTEAYQILKLPLLVEHYIQHKHGNPGLSLVGFLRLHYSDRTVFDADYLQDKRLPFKTKENTSFFSAVNDIPQPMNVAVEIPLMVTADYVLMNARAGFSASPNSVFQPPRA